MIDAAVVPLQIGGLLRHSGALHIVRCRDEKRGGRADPAQDQCGIADLANTELKIDSLFDEVAKPVK